MSLLKYQNFGSIGMRNSQTHFQLTSDLMSTIIQKCLHLIHLIKRETPLVLFDALFHETNNLVSWPLRFRHSAVRYNIVSVYCARCNSFQPGWHSCVKAGLGRVLGQRPLPKAFLPAIGPAPCRRRSQSSSLSAHGVCQKSIWQEGRNDLGLKSCGWTAVWSLRLELGSDWMKPEPVSVRGLWLEA